jgi:hypothetical protein
VRVLIGRLVLIVAGTFLLPISGQASTVNSIERVQPLILLGQCADQQAFRAEIQSDDERGPRSVVTNLCDAPLTAFFLQSFSPKDEKAAGGRLWDAFTQNASPIGKDGHISFPLSQVVGEPFPDKLEVVAAIWADGSTFGNPARQKLILGNRIACEQSYDAAISLLQRGLQENWTREEYLEALDQRKRDKRLLDVAGETMESNLTRNPSVDSFWNLERFMRRLMELFLQEATNCGKLSRNQTSPPTPTDFTIPPNRRIASAAQRLVGYARQNRPNPVEPVAVLRLHQDRTQTQNRFAIRVDCVPE